MKRKKLPGFIKHPFLIEIFQTRAGRVFTNWVLQGMLYMNSVEIAYKIFLDVVMTIIIFYFLMPGNEWVFLLYSLLIAHTINWIINCQPVALLMHMDIGKNDVNHFINYIEKLENRIKHKKFIAACASYGSLSVGNYKPTSDIDIRIIMKKDFISKLRAANFCFIERFRAFISFFPLDLYAFTLDEVKQKMSPKEPPVIFNDASGILESTYDELISFSDFDKNFREVVLPAQKT